MSRNRYLIAAIISWALAGLVGAYAQEWRQVLTAHRPSARMTEMATLGADAILFGGWGGTQNLSDTWAFNGDWRVLQVIGPSARAYHAMASAPGGIYLYGGAVLRNGPADCLGQLWRFDGEWHYLLTWHSPGRRFGHAMVWRDGALQLYGGQDQSGTPQAETWTYGGDWTVIDSDYTPGPQYYPHMWGHYLLADPGVKGNATWRSDAPGRWEVGESLMPGRTDPGLTETPWGAVLMGGGTVAGQVLSDAWEWTGSWAPLPAGPSARQGAAMTYVEGVGVVLFGGTPYTAETWVLQ